MPRNVLNMFPLSQEVRRLELTVQKFHYAQHYDHEFIVEAHEQWQRSIMSDGFERRLTHYVYGRSHMASYSHPSDWWQVVKARWFPKRWLRRWPVQLKTVTFDAKALVPELKVMANRHIVAYFGELSE